MCTLRSVWGYLTLQCIIMQLTLETWPYGVRLDRMDGIGKVMACPYTS